MKRTEKTSAPTSPLRGKRGIAIAAVIAVILPLAIGLLFYPVANMQLKDLPFGVLSLDAGAQTPSGELNVGDTVVEQIESGEFAETLASSSDDTGSTSVSDMVSFRVFDSQEELDAALDNHEIYGAIVIPENFSELQAKALMAEQMAAASGTGTTASAAAAASGANATAASGTGAAAAAASDTDATAATAATSEDVASQSTAEDVETPTIQVIIDYAKSPMVASQLESKLTSALTSASDQFDVDVTTINEGPAAGLSDNGNPMAGMFSQMIVLMPLLICSIIVGVFVVKGLDVRSRKTAGRRIGTFAASLAIDAVMAALLSLVLFWAITYVAGVPADFAGFFGYCWVISLFLMAFFSGLACIRGRVAVVVGVLILLLGMTSAYLPLEALPAFWADWVVPWAPEYYMGNGLREVVFAGEGIWNAGTVCTGIYALVGICIGLLAAGLAGKKHDRGAEHTVAKHRADTSASPQTA